MRLFLRLILPLVLLVVLTTSASVKAFNPLGDVCKNAGASSACQQNSAQNGSTEDPAVKIIHTAANIVAVIAGVAAVVVIIVAGFQFVTAGGVSPGQRGNDPNKIKSARSALVGAIVGLVVIALAWTLVTFVTDRVIG